MDYQNHRALKDAARHSLAVVANAPRKLILIHTAVTIGVSLIGTLINLLLSLQIENTGGLSGIGLRSILSTTQSFLQVIVAIALPFWEAGYLYTTMNFARERKTAPADLLEGFRRFGPLLRSRLMLILIYFGVGILALFLSSQIFLMTPLSLPLVEVLESIPSDAAYVMDEATQLAIMDAYAPMMLILLALFSIGLLFVSYQFRMADYLILDHPGMGALAALGLSRVQMRMKKKHLFKLDLSFWWFYALQTLASLMAYGDYLLTLFGITVPISGEALFLICLMLSLTIQACLYLLARNQVFTAYAKFYDATALRLDRSPGTSQNPNT